LALNARREETRREYAAARAIRNANSPDALPVEYFKAEYDDPEEAEAMHNLYLSRCNEETTEMGLG
jgi:hypothetical protein